MRKFLKKSNLLKFIVKSLRLLKNDIFKKIYLLALYYKDLAKAKRDLTNGKFKLSTGDIYPCIFDKTEDTPIGQIYFYQDTWCAKKSLRRNRSITLISVPKRKWSASYPNSCRQQ